MKFFDFLTKKNFYIHLAIVIALIIIIIQICFSSLRRYTRHSEDFETPNLIGMNAKEVLDNFKDDFTFVLMDSVYVKDYPQGSIYQQDPYPGAKVKKGRNLYYVIVSVAPEKTTMPNLRNLSLRQAIVLIHGSGLKVGKLDFVDYFARNAIVEQLIDTAIVEPDTEVVKGSFINLRVGLGNGDKKTHLPKLIGMNMSNVKDAINEASLNLGNEIFMDNDEDQYYRVYRMYPEYSIETLINLGEDIDVWYRSENVFDFAAFNRELFVKDSIVNYMKINKMSIDSINFVIDSMDFIITHRKFSFDSLERVNDLNIRYERPSLIDTSDYGLYDTINVDDFEYEIDTNGYYYEE